MLPPFLRPILPPGLRRLLPSGGGLPWEGGGGGAPMFDILGGGASFSRSSEASYYTQPPTDDEGDVAGKAFLAWAASNIVRLDARDGTPMVLLEGARTNMYTQSRDLSALTGVGGTPTVTDNTDGAPDGDATSRRVEVASGVAGLVTYTGLTASQPYAASCFTRGVPAQALGFVRVWNGAIADNENPPTTTWGRSRLVATPPGTTCQHTYNSGFNTAGIGGLAAGARDGMYALPQVEGGSAANGAFASSAIRTAGASAARFSDRLEWAAGTWPLAMAVGGFRFTFAPTFTDSEDIASNNDKTLVAVGAGVADGVRLLILGGSTVNIRLAVNSVVQVTQQITFSRDQQITISVLPAAGTLTISGATTGNGTYAASGGEFSTRWQSLHAANVLYIGVRSGTSEHAFSRFSRMWSLL